MLLKFTGTTRRVVGEHVWSRENNWVAPVDADLAAVLITSPDDRFVIADEEPLVQLVGREHASLLLIEGVGSVEALSSLKASETRKVAESAGIEYGALRDWIKAARQEQGAPPGEDAEDGNDSNGG